MPITKESFVVPPLLTFEGVTVIAPRTRMSKGMAVVVKYARASTNEHVTMPRIGGAPAILAKILGEHEEDSSLVRVRCVGAVLTNTTRTVAGKEFVVPKRCCTIVHPDYEFYATKPDDGEWVPVVEHPSPEKDWNNAVLASFIWVAAKNYNVQISATAKASLAAKIASWNRSNTAYSDMVARCVRNFYSAAAQRGPDAKRRLDSWVKGRKERGSTLAKHISALTKDPCARNMQTLKAAVRMMCESGTLSNGNMNKLNALVAEQQTKHGFYQYSVCGHMSTHGVVIGFSQRDLLALGCDTGNQSHVAPRGICIECFLRHLESGLVHEAIDRRGDPIVLDTNYYSMYSWSDGTLRNYDEPPVIGGYHTSKQYLGNPLPHLNGKPAIPTPYVGYELEFVRVEGSGASCERIARKMMASINAALAGANLGTQRYCCFERDGSVEFELVSGYGPMDIHRAAVKALLADGAMAKEVRSHDGGKCGLHVHLDKPKSLIHAAKLTRFYNAEDNRPLLLSVARRYSAGNAYAKVIPGKMTDKDLAGLYKTTKGYGYSKRTVFREAMRRINADRYELLNFHNDNTVEVRAFRGSMRMETVLACLEFAYMSWHFTKDTPGYLLTTQQFIKYVNEPRWRHESKYLREYLGRRGFDTFTPSLSPTPVLPSFEVEATLINEV